MTINDQTKISEIIKANKESIEAIASVAKPLRRLRNPVLRKVMASRVTLREAAEMSNCSVEKIVAALEPLGYTYVTNSKQEEKQESKPLWLGSAAAENIMSFDVRPIIEEGTDPLKEILHRFKDVPQGHILCIINNFIPTPLIHLLKTEKAQDHYVEKVGEKEYHTYFLKKSTGSVQKQTGEDQVVMEDQAGFEQLLENFKKENIKELDVRALEMPGPMQAILDTLAQLQSKEVLMVHHKRVPVYLLEELADKDWLIHILNRGEGNVKMLIFRDHG